jgi:hypothetical protein
MITGRSARTLPALAAAGGLAILPLGAHAAAPVTIEFESLKVTRPPGLAVRRLNLAGVQSFPADGVVVECAISRRFGNAVCRAPGSNYPIDCLAASRTCSVPSDRVRPGPIIAAAVRIANLYEFDPAGLPGPANAPLHTRITVKLLASDVAPPSPTAGVSVLSMDAVNWRQKTLEYPERDHLLGVEGQAIVTCQIQGDGGLICGDATSAPQEGHFRNVAAQLEFYWRAEPQLVDGTPSAGRWVRILVTFKLTGPAPKAPKTR